MKTSTFLALAAASLLGSGCSFGIFSDLARATDIVREKSIGCVDLSNKWNDVVPELSPSRPLNDERRRAERRRDAREHDDSARETADGLRPRDQAPRSTGEPELRRRRQ